MFHLAETNFKIGHLIFAWIMVAALVLGAAPEPCYAQVLYKGKINSPKLNVRSEPNNDCSVVVVLNKGERVDVLEAKGGVGGWLTVEYNGMKGYIRNRSRYILLNAVSAPDKKKHKPAPRTENNSPEAKNKAAASKQAEKKAIEKQIQKEAKKIKEYSRQEEHILEGLNEIDKALNRARLKARSLRRDATTIALEIEKTQARMKKLNQSMKQTRDYAGKRLNALFRMYMLGRLEIAAPPSSLYDFVVTQNALKKVTQSDFCLLEKQARDLKELSELKQELSRRHKQKSELQEQLDRQVEIQKKEAFKKEDILKEIKRRKGLSLAARDSLENSAQELDKTISAMAAQTGSHGKKTCFAWQKGRLQRPVQGSIISRFGTRRKGDYNAFTFQSGIDIKAERGAPVKNVFSGEVMFAEWLKGYGNLMIIDHGNNYYTLYAHVEELYKKKGEQVDTGEVIGTAGDTGSIKGPCLHFEVRHHGKPVDPLKWLKS